MYNYSILNYSNFFQEDSKEKDNKILKQKNRFNEISTEIFSCILL